jgi:hypothetical protein
MIALIHVVDHMNERFEANCSGWRDVISHALLAVTLEGLQLYVIKVLMPWKVSITSMRTGNYHSLNSLPTFGSGMWLRVMRRTKRATTWGATMETGVVVSNPLVDANTSSRITSG